MAELTQKYVPGAPPSSKIQPVKKKRTKAKTKEPLESGLDDSTTALAEDSDLLGSKDVAAGQVQRETSQIPEDEPKAAHSIAELINKRLKAVTKKINRISGYATADVEKLNDDQKRSLKTLPALEMVQKELGEIKKIAETYELDQTHALSLKQAESERAEKNSLAAAVAENQQANQVGMSNMLTLLRLRPLLSQGHHDVISLSLDEAEGSAIFAVAELLLGEESVEKEATISGILSGQGDVNGVPYARLSEIVESFLNPRALTPVPGHIDEEVKDYMSSSVSDHGSNAPQTDVLSGPHSSAGLNFTTASEIELTALEDSTEWDRVEGLNQGKVPATTDLGDSMVNISLNDGTTTDAPVASPGEVSQPVTVKQTLDWADDESGFPSMNDSQLGFSIPDVAASTEDHAETAGNGDGNGSLAQGEEGFQEARFNKPRGVGRGRRGGERGFSDRGFRGRGGFRKGFTGGDRGTRGYRPQNSADWRNDGRGRGRGYGRGRGSHEGQASS